MEDLNDNTQQEWIKTIGSKMIKSVYMEIDGMVVSSINYNDDDLLRRSETPKGGLSGATRSDEKWFCEECYKFYDTTPDICDNPKGCDNKDRWWLCNKKFECDDNWYNLIKESKGFKKPEPSLIKLCRK